MDSEDKNINLSRQIHLNESQLEYLFQNIEMLNKRLLLTQDETKRRTEYIEEYYICLSRLAVLRSYFNEVNA